jgi:hypothetical protein
MLKKRKIIRIIVKFKIKNSILHFNPEIPTRQGKGTEEFLAGNKFPETMT